MKQVSERGRQFLLGHFLGDERRFFLERNFTARMAEDVTVQLSATREPVRRLDPSDVDVRELFPILGHHRPARQAR